MAGGAVEATAMLCALLCPGTFSNVFARDAAVATTRVAGPTSIPALSAAARDILGWIEGTAFVTGTGRALKPWTFDLTSTRIVVSPLTLELADGTDAGRGSSAAGMSLSPFANSREGKGGEDAKMEQIWSSAMGPFGDPYTCNSVDVASVLRQDSDRLRDDDICTRTAFSYGDFP